MLLIINNKFVPLIVKFFLKECLMYKLLVSVLLAAAVSFGDIITISPPGAGDIRDLDHNYAYLWRIDLNSYLNLQPNETITGVSLFFDNITDWTNEVNDILWVNMVDPNYIHGSNSVTFYTDNQNPSNFFSIIRRQYFRTTLIDTWSDPNSASQTDDITFNIDLAAFLDYISDDPTHTDQAGWIGFGLDGDCHYWNDGVRLVINTTTTNVPEPTLLSLLGCGLLGLLFIRRKR